MHPLAILRYTCRHADPCVARSSARCVVRYCCVEQTSPASRRYTSSSRLLKAQHQLTARAATYYAMSCWRRKWTCTQLGVKCGLVEVVGNVAPASSRYANGTCKAASSSHFLGSYACAAAHMHAGHRRQQLVIGQKCNRAEKAKKGKHQQLHAPRLLSAKTACTKQ